MGMKPQASKLSKKSWSSFFKKTEKHTQNLNFFSNIYSDNEWYKGSRKIFLIDSWLFIVTADKKGMPIYQDIINLDELNEPGNQKTIKCKRDFLDTDVSVNSDYVFFSADLFGIYTHDTDFNVVYYENLSFIDTRAATTDWHGVMRVGNLDSSFSDPSGQTVAFRRIRYEGGFTYVELTSADNKVIYKEIVRPGEPEDYCLNAQAMRNRDADLLFDGLWHAKTTASGIFLEGGNLEFHLERARKLRD